MHKRIMLLPVCLIVTLAACDDRDEGLAGVVPKDAASLANDRFAIDANLGDGGVAGDIGVGDTATAAGDVGDDVGISEDLSAVEDLDVAQDSDASGAAPAKREADAGADMASDCEAGACGKGGCPSPNCDDANVCTTDSCVPATGCSHVPAKGPCDDGNPCTQEDTCAAGVCGGLAILCVDNNPCTDDICVSGQCVHHATKAACDDGDPCTFDSCDIVTGECDHINLKPCGVAPTWSAVWKAVIMGHKCMNCHSKDGMEITEDLEATWNALVNKPTIQSCATSSYIKPGDANASLLYLKVKNGANPGCGDKMPKGSQGIDDEDAALLKVWINAGAKK